MVGTANINADIPVSNESVGAYVYNAQLDSILLAHTKTFVKGCCLEAHKLHFKSEAVFRSF